MRSQFNKSVKMHVGLSVHIKYQYHSDTKTKQRTSDNKSNIQRNKSRHKLHEVCAVFLLLHQYPTVHHPKNFKTII